jgi:tripartite-type tricarboxylate transporter receptor subunit TctC
MGTLLQLPGPAIAMRQAMRANRSLYRTGMLLAGVAIGCGIWLAAGAVEQLHPNRAIRLVVPYVAGGPTDIVARAIADKLSVSLGRPVVTENLPGAGGNIGTEAIARAQPDGHTLGLLVNTTLTVNPSVYRKLPFNPDKDIRPLSIVTTTGQMLVVHPNVAVQSVADFVAYAKVAAARKEPISYASAGNGTPSHLAMEYFRLQAGFEAIHVPYRSVAPMLTDLLAGQVKVAFVGSTGMADHIRAGRLKGLGVSHAVRSPLAPEVPTIAEAGYPGFAIETYQLIVSPAGISEPVAALLEREIKTALNRPDLIERFRLMDIAPLGLAGAEARQRITDDTHMWAKVVAATNMRLD